MFRASPDHPDFDVASLVDTIRHVEEISIRHDALRSSGYVGNEQISLGSKIKDRHSVRERTQVVPEKSPILPSFFVAPTEKDTFIRSQLSKIMESHHNLDAKGTGVMSLQELMPDENEQLRRTGRLLDQLDENNLQAANTWHFDRSGRDTDWTFQEQGRKDLNSTLVIFSGFGLQSHRFRNVELSRPDEETQCKMFLKLAKFTRNRMLRIFFVVWKQRAHRDQVCRLNFECYDFFELDARHSAETTFHFETLFGSSETAITSAPGNCIGSAYTFSSFNRMGPLAAQAGTFEST